VHVLNISHRVPGLNCGVRVGSANDAVSQRHGINMPCRIYGYTVLQRDTPRPVQGLSFAYYIQTEGIMGDSGD
jgi:hypothetical protein